MSGERVDEERPYLLFLVNLFKMGLPIAFFKLNGGKGRGNIGVGD